MTDPLVSKIARRFLAEQTQEEGEVVAVAPPGWEGPIKHMKKDDEVDNPWALAWYMKNKGDTPHVKKEALLVARVTARILNGKKP